MSTFLSGAAGNKRSTDVSDESPLPAAGYVLEGTLVASAARTTNDNSDDLNNNYSSRGAFFLNVTAVSGLGPALDVVIEAKDPVSGEYFTIGTFTQKTAAGKEAIFIGGGADVEFLTKTIRARWTITDTVTFSLGYTLVS